MVEGQQEAGLEASCSFWLCPELWLACGCTWDTWAKGGASWGDWSVFSPTPRPTTPPSLEAMDATMVSRLEELLRTAAPSWLQLPRARARAWAFPSVLCLAPTICTGMWGVWGGWPELLAGGGAGRMGGGFLEGSWRGRRSPCKVLGWMGMGPFPWPDFSAPSEVFCRGCTTRVWALTAGLMVAVPTGYPWGWDVALDVRTRVCAAVGAVVPVVRVRVPWSKSWERGMEDDEDDEAPEEETGWALRLVGWG